MNVRINCDDGVATSCKILVKFGSVTPEITRVEAEFLQQRGNKLGKKSAYLIEYRNKYWANLLVIFSFGRNM